MSATKIEIENIPGYVQDEDELGIAVRIAEGESPRPTSTVVEERDRHHRRR